MNRDRWTGPLPAFLSRHAQHPLMFRPAATDAYVFQQVFVDLEYACLDDIADPGLVVDCGANVGYSSAYFLTQYPECRVVAIEPDPGNFALLQANLAPYGDRVTMLEGAVWPETGSLALAEDPAPYRGGGEWARQVRPDGAGVPVRAFTVDEVIELAGGPDIGLLKVDIEGAEVELFARNIGWLDRVRRIAIELHDDSAFGSATAVVGGALREDFASSRSGELTIFERRTAA